MEDKTFRVGLVYSSDGSVDFIKSMKEINIELNKNYNEFKLVQAQWDESTTTTQKLREEQEYLQNAYEIQRDKVNLLKEELNELENAENKNVTAIKKKRNELMNAEVQLQSYDNKVKKTTTELENAEKGIKSAAERLKELTQKAKENESAFELTKSQYTATTKETQKLKDEQAYLTEACQIQKEKIELLNTQLAELEGKEEKNTVAISKKKEELIKAGTELNNYNKKLQEVKNELENVSAKMVNFGEKIEKAGGKIEGAGKKASAFSTASTAALVGAAKTAIDFEDAFTGVEKTVDGTAEQMDELKQGIRDMAKEIPSSTTEISAVAEAAGQLGIKTENILSFSKAMIDLGNSTNLSAEEAASSLARFANIMGMSQEDFDKLGSAIVDLGNNFATTEADIVEMSMRLAGAGKQVGLSEGEVLGLATALSSVGIEAEMGGSAISKAMIKMQNAVAQGGDKLNEVLGKTGLTLRELELMSANDSKSFREMSQSIGMTSTEVKQLITAGTNLEDFAKISGKTAEEFSKQWKEDAAGALTDFIKGLGDAENKGESAITMLSEMGLTEVRLRDSLLRAANAGDLFNKSIERGNKAWEDNTALTNEANKRYDTLKSKMQIALNKIKDMSISLGNKLMPHIENFLGLVDKWIKKFDELDDKQVETILKIAGIVAALGPALTILGKVTSSVGGAVKAIGTFVQVAGVLKGTITTANTTVTGFAKVISGIISPAGLAVAAIGAITGALIYFATKETEAQKEARLFAEEVANTKSDFEEYKNEVDKATEANFGQIESAKDLKEELKLLVDENGKVKEGYKGRVDFILNELNNALGTEYRLNGDVIDSYKELQGEIDNLIEKKKAEITLQNEQEKWAKAKETEAEAIEQVKNAQGQLNDMMEKYGTNYDGLKQRIQEFYDKKLELEKRGKQFSLEYFDIMNSKKEIEEIENVLNAYTGATDTIRQTQETQKAYETDYALFVEGKYNEIGNSIKLSTQDWTKYSYEELQKSIEEQSQSLELYKQLYENKGEEIYQKQAEQAEKSLTALGEELLERTTTIAEATPEEIATWKAMAEGSYSTYFDILSKAPEEQRKNIEQMTGVTAEKTPELVNETQKMASQVLEQIEKNPEFKQTAIENLRGMLNGLQDGELRELLKQAGVQDADKVIEGIRSGNLAEDAGMQILNSLKTGLNNSSWKNSLFSVARGIASTLSGLLTVKANVNGKTSILPGHKSGLDYVPKDNYVARLHKGERVLTKEENEDYMEAEKRNNRNSHTVSTINKQENTNTVTEIDYDKLSKAFLKALNSCKMDFNRDGLIRLIDNRLLEVM